MSECSKEGYSFAVICSGKLSNVFALASTAV